MDVKDFKDLKNPFPNFAGSSSGTGDSVNFDLYDEVCRGTFVVWKTKTTALLRPDHQPKKQYFP